MVKGTFLNKLQFFRNDQVDFSEIPGGASGNISRNRVHKCEDFYLLYWISRLLRPTIGKDFSGSHTHMSAPMLTQIHILALACWFGQIQNRRLNLAFIKINWHAIHNIFYKLNHLNKLVMHMLINLKNNPGSRCSKKHKNKKLSPTSKTFENPYGANLNS